MGFITIIITVSYWFGIDSLRPCVCADLIAEEIVSIGLALIVYEVVSGFDIDSKVKLNCTWIDTGLRNPYGVGHLLHINCIPVSTVSCVLYPLYHLYPCINYLLYSISSISTVSCILCPVFQLYSVFCIQYINCILCSISSISSVSCILYLFICP